MSLLSHPITARWPAQNPEVIQLYSFPTPNGIKISTMLEETGLPYEPHLVRLKPEDLKSPEFEALNPNHKLPAIIDPNGPGGRMLPLFESGAILIYLAEKSGRFLPQDPIARYQTIQWVMFQMSAVGPMVGQLGYFYHNEGSKMEDPTARDRFIGETSRLLGVLEAHLDGRDWMMDEFTIADIALGPWLNMILRWDAAEVTGYTKLRNVPAYRDRFFARPAVERAKNIPPRPSPKPNPRVSG